MLLGVSILDQGGRCFLTCSPPPLFFFPHSLPPPTARERRVSERLCGAELTAGLNPNSILICHDTLQSSTALECHDRP